MGLFDAFRKKKEEQVSASENDAEVKESGPLPEESSQEESPQEEKKEGKGLGGLIKGGLSSMLKAVGIGGWKAKQVKDLQPNFTSEDPLDHVLVLNKAGVAFGAIKNLGIYADITKVTFSHALKVTTEDDFVEITTEDLEMAGNALPSDDSSDNPFDFTFDDLLNRECPDLDGARTPDSVIPYSAE